MWLSMLLAACSGGSPDAAEGAPTEAAAAEPAPEAKTPAPAKDPLPAPVANPSIKTTAKLTTRDDVTLVADLYLGSQGKPGVVLMHMIPPHWDRTSWPGAFLTELALQGWNVCVPDRRGAGKSGGVAKEAYEGEKGKYDVEACVKRLEAHGIDKLAIIGASNGTTSALDYAVWAADDNLLRNPDVLGFMTGGAYTEKQNDVVMVEHIPSIFTYSSKEREWSHGLKDVTTKWTFHEYPNGEHGTKMFEVRPTVTQDLMRGLHKGFR